MPTSTKIRLAARLFPDPWGRIPSRSKGPTAKGKERAQMGKGRDEVEGRRSGKGGRGGEGKFAFS